MSLDLTNILIKHKVTTNDIPDGAKILTDSSLDSERYTILPIHKNMAGIELKQRIVAFLSAEGADIRIYVGIDPGVHIGVAIIHMHSILNTTLVLSLADMIRWLKQQIILLRNNDILFRVGDGVKYQSLQILERLEREFDAPVELVDESYTSIKQTNTRTIHEQAAIIIAQRQGNLYGDHL